jgi:hypothetical protein
MIDFSAGQRRQDVGVVRPQTSQRSGGAEDRLHSSVPLLRSSLRGRGRLPN